MNQTTEQLLRELAAHLGTTTEYLWSALVRVALYDAVLELAWIAGMVAWTRWGLRPMLLRWDKNAPEDSYDLISMKQVGTMALAILTVIVWIGVLAELIKVAGLWDPEALAVSSLLDGVAR